MFEQLTNKLSGILASIKRKTTITKVDIESAMAEIRNALLDADVALDVVKVLVAKIEKEALGEHVIKSLSPGQLIVKIVHDSIIEILNDPTLKVVKLDKKPKKIMLVGLQGSGKTTTSAKLIHYLTKDNKSKKSLLASVDVYRPAAIEQLEILSSSVGALFTKANPKVDKPSDILKRANSDAAYNNVDLFVLDTAGRLHNDDLLMNELQEIKAVFNPDEVLLVIDAMTGQDSINIAKEFKDKIGITGVILSRMDGDPRGGVALSMRVLTSVPILFVGVGEKVHQIELFDPKRIAGRILDMGDIVSFVERAQEAHEEDDEKISTRMKNGFFDMNDFAHHLKKITKMGGIAKMLQFLPGLGNMASALQNHGINESFVKKSLAIISSMTKLERRNPEIIKNSRKLRIISGSGVSVQEVNKLLKQFEQMQMIVKKMKNMPTEMISNMFNKMM